MEYRVLGRTNLKVSSIGIGVWQLSGPVLLDGKHDGFPDIGQDRAIDIIHACEDLGINLIDSAEIYGAGEGELRVGKALKGRRDKWILSAKFGIRKGAQGQRIVDVSPKTIQTSIEGTLKRLQTDYVDVYLYHASPDKNLIGEGREVLESLKRQGKLRFYGISTNDADTLKQMAESDSASVVMISQSLVTQPPELLSIVKQHNLGCFIRGALQNGLLSGKYFHTRPALTEEDIRHTWMNKLKTEQYAAFEKYIPEGSSMVAIALRYLLDFDTTHSILLGGKSVADYQNAVRAFDLPPFDSETKASLEALGKQLQAFYWRSQLKGKVINKLKKFLVR